MRYCGLVGNHSRSHRNLSVVPREREALRSHGRIDLRLDLGVQIGDDRVDAILAEVVLNPTDDDVIGEVVVWDVWRSRVDGSLLNAVDARRVALAVVSDDGVEHGGDDIGMPLVLGISDELRGGPSVGVGHKGEWLEFSRQRPESCERFR